MTLPESVPPAPAHEAEASPAPAEPAGAPAEDGLARRLLALAVVAGALAGLAAWGGGEAFYTPYAPLPPAPGARSGPGGDPKMAEMEAGRKDTIDGNNVAITASLLAAAVGLALGLAGGLARKSLPASAASGLLGLMLGAAAGYGCAKGLWPRYKLNQELIATDISISLLFHAAFWLPVGLAGGLAMGIALGSVRRLVTALFGGLIGAGIGAVIYEIIGATAFASSKAYLPVAPASEPRLVACLALGLSVAFIAAVAAGPSPRSRTAKPATDPAEA